MTNYLSGFSQIYFSIVVTLHLIDVEFLFKRKPFAFVRTSIKKEYSMLNYISSLFLSYRFYRCTKVTIQDGIKKREIYEVRSE